MNRVRHLCAVMVLCLTFAVSAHAGEISCGVTDPPPPPPPSATSEGEIACGAMEVAAMLLEGVLSVF